MTIKRENGNVPKALSGEDHITGFVAWMAESELPESFKTDHVQAISTIDKAEASHRHRTSGW